MSSSASANRGHLRCLTVTCLLLFVANSADGQGGPPMITDDPGTPGNGKWEIETAFTFQRTPERKTFEGPVLDFNYGWGERIQLKYEVGWDFVDNKRDPDRGRHSGTGNSLAGFKYRFLDEDRHGFALSLYPQIEFNTPPGVSRRGVVESGTNVFLPVEVSKTFGPIQVAGEMGYELIQHGRDQWMYGVVAEYPLTKKIELLGEFRGNLDQDFRRNDLILNFGTRISLTEKIGFIFSAGRSVRSSHDSPTALVYAGLRFLL